MKKVSIIIPVLNSSEVLRRQLIHFKNIGIPDDVEIIIVDDGSDPALQVDGVRLIKTNDRRPWTWALARNKGAKAALGEYLLMYDVDHIITRELLDACRAFTGDKIQFIREFAVIDENGVFTQDITTLVAYGFPLSRLERRGLKLGPLPNNFLMRKDIFWELGGYLEDRIGKPYPQGEDRLFKKAWHDYEASGKGLVHHERPTIYMFPNGYYCGDVDYNPFGLFHTLSRATRRNSKYKRTK